MTMMASTQARILARYSMMSHREKVTLHRCLATIPDRSQRILFLVVFFSSGAAMYNIVNDMDDRDISLLLAEDERRGL